MHKAIIMSCDTYFYILANQMGIDQMNQWMRQFGFGQKTGVDLQVKVKAYIQILNGKCVHANPNG